MTDTIEAELQALGKTAPRITPAHIESVIAAEYIVTADKAVGGANVPQLPSLALTTLCVLVLTNGYTIVGKSACAHADTFDAAIGARIAREDAMRQIWPLEGYVLRSQLAREESLAAIAGEVLDQRAARRTHTGLLDYGTALQLLKQGATVARIGWNGKGMFIWIKRGSTDRNKVANSNYAGVPGHLLDDGHEGTSTRLPCICMRAAGGETVEGWLASQTDQLAEDWVVVPYEHEPTAAEPAVNPAT